MYWNGAAWFVKTGELFRAQGGTRSDSAWGDKWRPLGANSIEGAREAAAALYGANGEHWDVPRDGAAPFGMEPEDNAP